MNDPKKDNPKSGRVPFFLLAGLLAATLAAGLHFKGAAVSVSSSLAGSPTPRSVTSGPVSLTARLNHGAVLSGRDGQVELELVLSAVETTSRTATVPTDVLVVLDRSGSMEGEKIAQGRAAVKELIDRLGARDRFALVSYSDEAELELPLETASREAKSRWSQRVRGIEASGSTNMSAGLDLAYESLRASTDEARAVRVLLISDGLANRGDATPQGLFARASRFASREQVVSTIGVGLDFNEFLMSSLADAGTGNYYYLENVTELADVFAREFSAGRTTVASGLAVTLEPGEDVEVVDAAGYPLSRDGRTVVFRPGALFSGQERSVWITYRVPSNALGDYELGRVSLDYKADGEARTLEISELATVACVADEAAFFASVDKDAWEDSVLGESYGRLKDRIARAVHEGNVAAAKEEINAYRTEQEWMNRALGVAGVERNLAELDELETKVEDAFIGRDQALKQNMLSKTTQSEAAEARRAGSKK